jgi:hypothetical protein
MYGLAERLGFDTPEAAWEANPLVRGSVNPGDYAVVQEGDANQVIHTLLEDADGDIKAAAADVDRSPSDEQKEAGNYQKGHLSLYGLDISLENPKGGVRSGKDKDGKEWKVTLPAHYGYIKGTEGKDKDHIDVFIGSVTDSEKIFVVNQQKLEGGFDEHKVMLCFDDRKSAIETYDKAYDDDLGPKLRQSVVSTTVDKFKTWLEKGDHKKQFKEVALAESDEWLDLSYDWKDAAELAPDVAKMKGDALAQAYADYLGEREGGPLTGRYCGGGWISVLGLIYPVTIRCSEARDELLKLENPPAQESLVKEKIYRLNEVRLGTIVVRR